MTLVMVCFHTFEESNCEAELEEESNRERDNFIPSPLQTNDTEHDNIPESSFGTVNS